MSARHHADIPVAERELFRAIKLLDPPVELANTEGAFDIDSLKEAGFVYRNGVLPDEAALQSVLYPGGVVAAVVNAAKWVWDRTKAGLRTISSLLSFVDKIYGTVDVTLDLSVLNTDDRFAKSDPMRTAWGSRSGREIAPTDIQVLFWTRAIRPTNPIPFKRLNTGRLGVTGRVTMNTPRECPNSWLCGEMQFVRVCYELENEAGFISGFLSASSVCDDTLTEKDFNDFKTDSSVQRDMENWDLSALTEVTDSYEYMRQIVGNKAKPAKVLVGKAAYQLSGFSEMAWAPCFGYGEVTVDIAVGLVAGIGVAFPPAAPLAGLAAGYLSVLGTSDIVITPENRSKDARGLVTHEYGHYALCDLVRKNGDGLLQDVVLTFDTIKAGEGNPDPDEDARVVNEAWADFFAGQIAGGYNYFLVDGAQQGVGFNASVDLPGLDENWVNSSSGRNWAVGRLATLMQDAFDGRPHRNHGPTSGESWVLDGGNIRYGQQGCPNLLAPEECRSGDYDLEGVRLGGTQIYAAVQRFMNARNALGHYSIEAFEQGAADVALEGESWCQACLMMSPHFRADATTAREMIVACEQGDLADRLGPPPRNTLELDAFTCEPCPPGTGMGADGKCSDCPVDLILDWSGSDACRTEEILHMSGVDDFCPDSFIVEIQNASGNNPVTDVTVDAASAPSGALACFASALAGDVTVDGSVVERFASHGIPCSTTLCPVSCNFGRESPIEGIRYDISGDQVRIVANAGALETKLLVRNHSSSCDVVVK